MMSLSDAALLDPGTPGRRPRPLTLIGPTRENMRNLMLMRIRALSPTYTPECGLTSLEY